MLKHYEIHQYIKFYMQNLKFRLADKKDITELVILINRAYREELESSWTNEAKTVAGARINEQQLMAQIELQYEPKLHSQLLVVELSDHTNLHIIGCIAIEYLKQTAEINTFCIAPEWQNTGYGKQVLNAAELYVRKSNPAIRQYSMWVLNVRHELIQYYVRRGYHLTEEVAEYPVDANVGQPLQALYLVRLVKQLIR